MSKDYEHTSLFPEFKPVSGQEWEERIQKDLKAENPDSLFTQTPEGITIKPFYCAKDVTDTAQQEALPGKFPYVRGHKSTTNNWKNIQNIWVINNSQEAINKAKQALANGADGILFIIENEEAFDLDYLIDQLDLAHTTVCYSVKHHADAFFTRLCNGLKQKQISPFGLKGFLLINQPISSRTAALPIKKVEHIIELSKNAVDFYGIAINGAQFGNNGATAVQEIALTLGAAVSYLRELGDKGIPPSTIFRNMQFLISAGTHYFMEIAKVRAIRWLWSGLVKATEEEPELAAHLRIHATTSSWTMTAFDVHTNILRATTETMGAIISGCDSISVLPFDQVIQKENAFSERIARNIPLILKHENFFDQAIDPAAGSYYIESLTQELAQKAWALFQEIEAQGGFTKAVTSGFINKILTATASEKIKKVTAGKEVLVGTNHFVNKQEKIDYNIEELIQSQHFDQTRASYQFEVMRFAALLHYQKQNQRPKAVIAIIGPDIQEHIHAAFAKEFFDCSNFDTQILHFDSVKSSLEKLLFVPCKVIVLSSTESQFSRFYQHFTEALKKHKNRPLLIIAASPEEMKEELLDSGFDGHIFQNCDATSIIGRIQERLLNGEL
ncbi:methylmalonyl-CoA mutase family protein [Adhaeribacter aquaticus]|uniref:methylmalonyl-CoA mutase family protein n=1 Tax=Adhaeribacter aquaticus TaxID=299567 RepID=UPI0004119744|nr:methylmalonyl-CoA mutase family protein [Adhaeribacter aquaticus]